MNDKEQAAMQLALEALELHLNGCGVAIATRIAYDALREALDPELQFIRDWNEGKVRRVSDGKVMGVAEQAERRPQYCGTGYCSCIECPYKEQQIEQSKLTEDEISKTISNNIFKAWGVK